MDEETGCCFGRQTGQLIIGVSQQIVTESIGDIYDHKTRLT